ncbi:MAG: hypothetical protein M3383_05045 [Actinomycetota bacterium]|nr:hypothetical protein [Actinomycetota bacterium]
MLAFLIGAVILVILLFGIRACLDQRKERAYENYLRDLSALITTSSQLSHDFFTTLGNPGDASVVQFQDQISASRGTGEDLFQRAEGLSPPGELSEAQADLELAFEFRRDALSSIVEQVPSALGDEGRIEAIKRIALDMRQFLASDVLYSRAREATLAILSEEEIGGDVPESVFLPDTDPWLDYVALTGVLSQVGGETGSGDPTRGTEISATVLKPGNVPLVPDSPNALGEPPREIEISVLNGGVAEEVDVAVAFELVGGIETVADETTIPRIGPGNTESALIPIAGEIPTGVELTLTVTVLPVPGETIVDNNESTYRVTFG